MAILWWRSWHGAPLDAKWPVIAARAGVRVGVVSAVAWALMDYASQHKDRGSIEGFDTEVYAVYSGFPENEIIAIIKAMTDKGILIDGKFANWEKRQPKREDDSAARVRDWREKKRGVTQCNTESGSETSDSLSVSVSLSNSVSNELDIKEADEFTKIRRVIERETGLPGDGMNAVKAIDNIIKNGCTEADVIAGIQWRKDEGKPITSYVQIVGPSNTARLKRIQGGNGKANAPHVFAETYQ
jgi:hypothetical protein